ncbi:hypothetical protein Q7689_01830 [Nocardiopsis tropica]|uniref:Uncharacterized protein n=1 Tax=Streptomonospora nanhaiensis TaxID=1323731 RepID=A0ABY6YWU8_9ACTN|nr:hypothetical protein [Streptomonospora nanhaiensis]MEE2042167.1 hypothetical protein [Nocardiopsis tropica]WAE76668.1 hypothetical protein OUQ99_21150 [Streptomonospora nanhaiensis]
MRTVRTVVQENDSLTVEHPEVVVQGYRLTDREALAQLSDVLPDEQFVVVPRELLTRFAPKE